MQKTVYLCDGCGEVVGNQAHITLVLQTSHPGTGVALPPGTDVKGKKTTSWTTAKLNRNFIHLHYGCAGKFFKQVAAVATKGAK